MDPRQRILRSRWPAAAASVLLVCGTASPEEADEPTRRSPPPARSGIVETVRVHATRLPADAVTAEEVPAHVTVIDGETIRGSGATTLQDLLLLEAGVVVYDQSGNAVEKRFDLRGFTEGAATKVFLDGAPLNDTRNNELSLQLVPLELLERIEIVRGSASNSAGGGSEAGVIHLYTAPAERFGGKVGVAAGTHATKRLRGGFRDRRGRVDYALWGLDERTDGFRENAGGDLRRLAATLGVDLGRGRRLHWTLTDARSEFGTPGALTREEYAADPSAAPYNTLDFSDQGLQQLSANYRGRLAGGVELAANAFHRRREAESLSTGRAASTFGGFFLDAAASASGADLQLAKSLGGGDSTHDLTAGVEWVVGATDASAFVTSPDDPGRFDRDDPASVNTARRRTVGLYVRDGWRPADGWTLHASARLDRDRVEYRETLPDPGAGDSRTFSELSLRAGVAWSPDRRRGLYLAYGESFLPPTAEQLFAFPGFGSNPDLRPQDSRSYELGFRGRWAPGLRLDAALLQIDTEDEIVFVPGSDPSSIGRNENLGRTRRRGVEAALTAHPRPGLGLFANLTLLRAEFRSGPSRGSEVPLVPGRRLAAGFDLALHDRWKLRAEALFVGEQVLDNDDANEQAKLDAYTVLNARLGWTVGTHDDAPSASRSGGVEFFVELRNLLDREYATRGIYAFDASSGANAVFLTPAPDRRVLAGVDWDF